MGKTIKTEAVKELFEAILTLENVDECFDFFEDVCTVNEVLSIAQRFSVAKMLRDNKTYLEVAKETGASTATISRVNRSLNYGNDGYEMVFSRLNK
ncbi:MAG: YerC/YecD family TrpR-related protein [Clostridium sp.]|nr:TrpR YerC/YecD [Lachnospiraceae bacterium]MCM1172774.1 YerC/YecD family TrpR-related protein [Clostridium sp.]MCM1209367.1 YerC/YecD family TrpR-related protein [Ruminococcus sp.]MCM1287785.1 YerC/YecD family TrpR-related protein [Clostridium sp.]